MSRFATVLSMLCLLVLLPGCSVYTQSTEADSWSYLTQDEAGTSSRCIGRPETPLCAVETLLACFQRGAIGLCRLVDDDTEQYAQIFAVPTDPRTYLAYRVLAEQRLESAASLGVAFPTGLPGDVLLSLDQREGSLGQPAGGAAAAPSDFLLRRQPNGAWRLVGWGNRGD